MVMESTVIFRGVWVWEWKPFIFEIFPLETFLSRGNLRDGHSRTHGKERRKTSSISYVEREKVRKRASSWNYVMAYHNIKNIIKKKSRRSFLGCSIWKMEADLLYSNWNPVEEAGWGVLQLKEWPAHLLTDLKVLEIQRQPKNIQIN